MIDLLRPLVGRRDRSGSIRWIDIRHEHRPGALAGFLVQAGDEVAVVRFVGGAPEGGTVLHHVIDGLRKLRRPLGVLRDPSLVADSDRAGTAVNAHHPALGRQPHDQIVAEAAGTRHRGGGDVARHHRGLAHLDDLVLRVGRGVGDVDEDPERVHLFDQCATAVVDAAPMSSAAGKTTGHVGIRVESALRGELHGPEAEPVKRSQHVEIALLVPARFAAEEDGHPAAVRDRARLFRRQGKGHLVFVRLREPMEGLEHTQDVLRRRVVGPVSVSAEVFDDDVDARLLRPQVVPSGAGGRRLPGVDPQPEGLVRHVDVTIHQDAGRAFGRTFTPRPAPVRILRLCPGRRRKRSSHRGECAGAQRAQRISPIHLRVAHRNLRRRVRPARMRGPLT